MASACSGRLAPASLSVWTRSTLGMRFSSTKSGRSFPQKTYSKAKQEARVQRPIRNWKSINSPALVPKFLRLAEHMANKLGVSEEVRAFDEAAAAFPNPSPVIANTILERPSVIMRDIEAWEADFLDYSMERQDAEAKRYPDRLYAMFEAGSAVIDEDAGAAGRKGASAGAGEGEAEGGAADGAADGSAAASGAASDAAAPMPEAPTGFSDFYERNTRDLDREDDSSNVGVFAPRESQADKNKDVRSLDRAYSQRLALLVRDRGTGAWGFPGGPVREGEAMTAAARRALVSVFPDPELDAWFVGNAPIGHRLAVYDPATQAATGCYGAKHFFYRAVLIHGRFSLAASGGGLDDFAWLARDEMEGVLDRPAFKYFHQLVGAGHGEEFSRRAAWLKRVQDSGLSIAQASGRRAFRLSSARAASRTRLPAIATVGQAAVAAMSYRGSSSAEKAAAVEVELAAHHARVRAQRQVDAGLRERLAVPRAMVRMEQERRGRAAVAAAAGGPAAATA